ncbi:hypothetical protein RND81_03G185200 [Saponaria officinalis]|uniref:Uncharacterized protein n=1 Tax=Saponaria officinalis TaxID=3572 RepID=A0AAW1M564_SAPOF
MSSKLLYNRLGTNPTLTLQPPPLSKKHNPFPRQPWTATRFQSISTKQWRGQRRSHVMSVSAAMQPLDLTEENVETVLKDARAELAQLFDGSVGITGQAELAEVDGPFVKIRLKGKFWHKRSTVLARLENYLKQRIPEILEVDIEDEKQLDDSPANF